MHHVPSDFANRRVQQRRVPQPPALRRRRTKSFSLPKQAQLCCVSSLSAISGFRSLCGRERHSSFSHRAQLTCVLEPFNRRALVRDSGLHPRHPLRGICGASNPGPMLWPERSRSRGIFQEVFLRSNQDFIDGFLRPPTARRMPARSALGGALRRQPRRRHQGPDIAAWPCPTSTTRTAPGRQQPRRLRDQGAIGVEPVGAAVERGQRIVVADLGGEPGDIGRADIGRIRDDQVERA